jgi:hypothetical protein
MPRSQLRWNTVVACSLLAAALTAAPAPASAQQEFGIGLGVSVPVYEASHEHTPGPHLFLFSSRARGARLALRTEASLSYLPASSTQRGGWGLGALSVAGVHGTLVYTPFGGGSGPYTFIGIGAHFLHKPGNVRALIPGPNLGIGANLEVGGREIFVQARAEAPLTPFGTATEFSPTIHLPLTVGVRLPGGGR